jgi:PRTRC genetic system protein C
MAEVNVATRKFKFKGIELDDPNPNLEPEMVRDHYMGLYPDMLNTRVVRKADKGEIIYEFQPKTGGHG